MDKVAQELRVGVATLERWRAKALGAPRTERTWTATARLEAVMAIAALATPAEVRARPEETRKDRRRIQELEREMRRKDKALAETAALLVLSKTSRRYPRGRGRTIPLKDRQTFAQNIRQAQAAGACLHAACALAGIDSRALLGRGLGLRTGIGVQRLCARR